MSFYFLSFRITRKSNKNRFLKQSPKFPENPKDDQFFNVLRPLMETNIEALTVPMT